MTPQEKKKVQSELIKYRTSLPYYASKCLHIQTKENELSKLVMNNAQRIIHTKLEEQLKETGRVRAMILKGRQQGASTYTAARFYRRATLNKGINVYILSHEQKATDNLFDMVDRFHKHNPIAPTTGVANAKELVFDRLDSKYAIATAGAREGGRGRTSHLFHGSEVGFWNNAAAHFASSVQAVPDARGTEIILESTANGASGEFFERWNEAEAGKSDYTPIFIPWFVQDEYSRPVPTDFELSNDALEGEMSEAEYAEMFELSMEKMAWRRSKIQELRSVSLFNQEYPATPSLAFQSSDGQSYIKGQSILRARKSNISGDGPLILGVDPAGEGGDRFAIAFRRGHECEQIIYRDKVQATEACDWLDAVIQEHQPAMVNIDAGGLGGPIITFLRARRPEYQNLVNAVNFGSRSQHKNAYPRKPGPKLRRDEMWQRMKEWLDSEEGAKLPDIDVLQTDLVGPKRKPSHNNDFSLESKDSMRARKVRSPDLADALALTFANLKHIPNWVDKKPSTVYASNIDRPRSPNIDLDGHYGTGGGSGWMAF